LKRNLAPVFIFNWADYAIFIINCYKSLAISVFKQGNANCLFIYYLIIAVVNIANKIAIIRLIIALIAGVMLAKSGFFY